MQRLQLLLAAVLTVSISACSDTSVEHAATEAEPSVTPTQNEDAHKEPSASEPGHHETHAAATHQKSTHDNYQGHAPMKRTGGLAIGEVVPDFEVTLDGKVWRLSELRANKELTADGTLALTFWCSFCHSCRDVEMDLDKLASELKGKAGVCLLYTSPSPRDLSTSRMPSSA